MENVMNTPSAASDRLRQFSYYAAVAGALAASLATMGTLLYLLATDPVFRGQVVHEHARVALGFPVCTVNSFVTVVVLQATSGPIEFKVLGMEFKGAGGPLALYVVVFGATVLAFQTLWG